MTNETMTCARCGWRCTPPVQDESAVVPPELSSPHPIGHCVSPFEIGQVLYWGMDLADQDAPPLRVVFREIVEFQSPTYSLQGGEWVKEEEAKPTIVAVQADPSGIYPQHEKIYGRELLDRPIDVLIGSLHAVEKWPTIEVS